MRNYISNEKELLKAAQNGKLEDVQSLLKNGVDVNYKGDNKFTALCWAAYCGHLTVVEELLDRGANVDAQNEFGDTALHSAACRGHLTVVKNLLNRGANVDAQNEFRDTALHSAARGGHLDVVKALLAKGANKDMRDISRQKPADVSSNQEIKYLLENYKVSNACSSATFLGYGAGVGLMATGVGLLVDDLMSDSQSLDDNFGTIAALMLVGLLLLAGTWGLSRPSSSSSIDDNAFVAGAPRPFSG